MIKIAIQGVEGSFHEIAAHRYFEKEKLDVVPCETFKELFGQVVQDPNTLGIVAIENTIAGSLLQNHDLLRQSKCQVIGEYKLRIELCLATLPNQDISTIREVHSHPMALMQCSSFLENYRHIKVVEQEDTALSAKHIADNKTTGIAAVCSKLAAQKYGLTILANGIETNKHNYTRFLVIANPTVYKDYIEGLRLNKSTIVFTLPHEEGSLSKILTILSFYHINLTKIQSLPIVGREWEYQFYIVLLFDDYIRYKQSLNAIRPLTRYFEILGEYVEAPTPKNR